MSGPEYTLCYMRDCPGWCDNWPLREELSSSVQLAVLLSLMSLYCLCSATNNVSAGVLRRNNNNTETEKWARTAATCHRAELTDLLPVKHVNRQVKKPGTTVRPHSAVVCLIAWLTERLHIPDHDGIKTAKASKVNDSRSQSPSVNLYRLWLFPVRWQWQ